MKTFGKILILCLLAMAGCKSKKTAAAATAKPREANVTRVAYDKIDQAQKDKAYELGRRVLMACNTSRFKPFTEDEATPEVIRNATPERLTKTCHNFQLKYGDFKGVTFVEAMRDKKSKLTIYRFKADYEKKIANKELRVIMNSDGLVSGIKSLDWQDAYH
jgi:hypothetical protein